MSKSSFFQLNVRPFVFWPPFILLISAVLSSIFIPEIFSNQIKNLQQAILTNFSIGFSWTALFMFLLVIVVFVSPLGKYRIGGPNAKPRLTKLSWFAIVLCTTIAVGILFWGSAEPLNHYFYPPDFFDLDPGSKKAKSFALGALFFHWGFIPYSIYAVPSLVFGLMLYSGKPNYSLINIIKPIVGEKGGKKWIGVLDSICLFALVTGMAASLGGGILSLSGGVASFFPSWHPVFIQPAVTLLILITFLISAATGIDKGIRTLSLFNLGFFLLLLILFVVLGQGLSIFPALLDNLRTYGSYFLDLSLQLSGAGNQWTYDWTTFNLAIWVAWAPITALFLGKIAVGRTVREFLLFNLFLPALFCMSWMSIFGGATLQYAEIAPDFYQNLLETAGPESIIYQVSKDIGYFKLFSQLFILAMFISFVTAADSSTDALASISMKKTGDDVFKSDVNLKVLWGTLMASLAWVMITFAGIDGIRMLSVIGGLPALLLILLATASLVLLVLKPKNFLP